MQTSEIGLKVLMLREGWRTKAYKDSKGIWTDGVGHTKDVHEGDVWTDDYVLQTFRQDIKETEDVVNKGLTVPVTQNQFDALVSFTFNVGEDAFLRSTLLKKLNAGDIQGASDQFDRWHIPPEITSRRNSEKAQFNQK